MSFEQDQGAERAERAGRTAPRRLLHLVSSLEVGGKERIVLSLAREARTHGLDHRLLLFDAPFRSPAQDLDPGDVPWEFEPRGPGLSLAFTRRLARRLDGWDAVHAHNDTAVCYAALAACLRAPLRRSARPPVFGTFHTYPGHDTPRARRLTRWAAGRAEGVVAASDELAARLGERGWTERCGVIWNGVEGAASGAAADTGADPAARAALRASLGVAPETLLVGTVARLDAIKRHEDLLAAVELARAGGAPIACALAGDGPLLEELRGRCVDRPYVRHLGNRTDVPHVLEALDVFVLCSDHEVAPCALLEAMSAGLACVVTGVGGMPHVVAAAGPEPAALVVPPRDPARLAAALEELRDPARRRALGERARERARHFDAGAMYARYVALWTDGHAPARGPGAAREPE